MSKLPLEQKIDDSKNDFDTLNRDRDKNSPMVIRQETSGQEKFHIYYGVIKRINSPWRRMEMRKLEKEVRLG